MKNVICARATSNIWIINFVIWFIINEVEHLNRFHGIQLFHIDNIFLPRADAITILDQKVVRIIWRTHVMNCSYATEETNSKFSYTYLSYRIFLFYVGVVFMNYWILSFPKLYMNIFHHYYNLNILQNILNNY